MKLLLIQVFTFSLFFLVLFALTFNHDATAGIMIFMKDNGLVSALASVLILTADIILPIPSSVVMLLNGKLFGVLTGTLVSTIGLMLSTFAGYFIGKKIKGPVSRFISPAQQEQSERLFQEWGLLILIISRPIPLLSESISIVSGMQRMPFYKVFLSAIAGSLPGALLYAYYGTYSNTEQNQYISFLVVIGIASLAFFISRFLKHTLNKKRYELF